MKTLEKMNEELLSRVFENAYGISVLHSMLPSKWHDACFFCVASASCSFEIAYGCHCTSYVMPSSVHLSTRQPLFLGAVHLLTVQSGYRARHESLKSNTSSACC